MAVEHGKIACSCGTTISSCGCQESSSNVLAVVKRGCKSCQASLGAVRASMGHQAVIREEDGKYCVKSEKGGTWSGGCYDTKEKAEERLRQVEFFKRR